MRLKREKAKDSWVPYIYVSSLIFSPVLMSLVILLTVGSTGAHELQKVAIITHFPVWLSMARKAFPKVQIWNSNICQWHVWLKQKTTPSPTQALSTHHVSSMALELTLGVTKKSLMVPMLVELTVSGRRYTSKSTDACADFRVRKILNLKNKTKH